MCLSTFGDDKDLLLRLETSTENIFGISGVIQSKDYPMYLRTNMESTWNIHMNESNELEIDLTDVHLDRDNDYLQLITGGKKVSSMATIRASRLLPGGLIYSLNASMSYRFLTMNQTKLILRTKHGNDDYQYRGFNLTYRSRSRV